MSFAQFVYPITDNGCWIIKIDSLSVGKCKESEKQHNFMRESNAGTSSVECDDKSEEKQANDEQITNLTLSQFYDLWVNKQI